MAREARGWRTLALCTLALGSLSAHFTAKAAVDPPLALVHVVGIVDGDTMDVLITPENARRLGYRKRKTLLQQRVRVAGIDAPERGQAWSKRAKQALSAVAFDRDLLMVAIDIDRYDRVVGVLFLPPRQASCTLNQIWQAMQADEARPCDPAASVNDDMVIGGHAWAYGRYAGDAEVCDLEAEARFAKRGLWSQPTNTWIAPWDFRRQVRDASPERSTAECKREAGRRH